MLSRRRNRAFLTGYRQFVSREWLVYYFQYDHFKAECGKLQETSAGSIELQGLDRALLEELQRVHRFLVVAIEAIHGDLALVSQMVAKTTVADQQVNHNIERALRGIFTKCLRMEEFFELNHFAMTKLFNKLDNLRDNTLEDAEGLPLRTMNEPVPRSWETHESRDFFHRDFSCTKHLIENLTRHCSDLYIAKYRPSQDQLARYELKFVKSTDRVFKSTRVVIGIKLGLIVAVLMWIVVDSNTTSNSLHFWDQPGLYVYTTIGNFLLYRLGWAFQVYIWSSYDVNYITALNLSPVRPNLMLVVNQTASALLMFCVNLLVFFKSNSDGSALKNTFLSYACPVFLVGAFVALQAYDKCLAPRHERPSRGIFTKGVFLRCLQAPFVPVTLRDVFAADIMTSFARVIADSLYASCWIVSGAFLHGYDESSGDNSATDFGSESLQCTGTTAATVITVVEMLPLLIRALQCLRGCCDEGWSLYPQGYNLLKYMLSMLVVFFALATGTSQTAALYTLVVVTTLYKWWWDVVMDWGLGERLPASLPALLRGDMPQQAQMWLRDMLMYPSLASYYVAVVVDLLLRFAWVVSLLPQGSFGFVGNQLTFFLASLEIVRRSIWGCFRIEWEHVKQLRKGSSGYLSTAVIRAFAAKVGDKAAAEDPATSPQVAQSAAAKLRRAAMTMDARGQDLLLAKLMTSPQMADTSGADTADAAGVGAALERRGNDSDSGSSSGGEDYGDVDDDGGSDDGAAVCDQDGVNPLHTE